MLPWRLTIRQYTLMSVGMLVVLYGIYGWFTLERFADTSSQITLAHTANAQRELREALQEMHGRVRATAARVVAWQEVHQQLQNPLYFAYWYSHRLIKNSLIDQYTVNLMLYDPQGKALDRHQARALPTDLRADNLQPRIVVDDGKPYLVHLQKILVEDGRLLGFLATQTEFLGMLREHDFNYVEGASLSCPDCRQDLVEPLGMDRLLRYDQRPMPELDELRRQVERSLLNFALIVGIPVLLTYSLMAFLLGRPVSHLSDYIEHLRDQGEGELVREPAGWLSIYELERVRLLLQRYHQELSEAHHHLDMQNKELWTLAQHDPLTGVLNRRAFDEHWRSLIEVVADQRVELCFLLFDVNHFKAINDTYGHEVGDRVLQAFAEKMTGVLRKGEHFFRLGGDEFCAILLNCDRQSAAMITERCQQSVAAIDFRGLGLREPLRVSIGVAHCDAQDRGDFSDMKWQADAAMYTAKKPGQPNVVFYSESLSRDSHGILSSWIAHAVYDAIENSIGLEIYYQPIWDMKQDAVSYYEALVRIHKDDEVIMPAAVFSVIQGRHLELEMDRAIVARIVADLEADRIPAGTGVSINLSGPTVVHPSVGDWLTPLQPYLSRYQLMIEVTETVLVTELEVAGRHMNSLREKGFKVALDDFGSGYSSFRYLTAMPVDVVKFDMSLVQSLFDDSQRDLTVGLATMLLKTGYHLVAEGIETEEMRRACLQAGFGFGQGYLLGRPQPWSV